MRPESSPLFISGDLLDQAEEGKLKEAPVEEPVKVKEEIFRPSFPQLKVCRSVCFSNALNPLILASC